jgi:LuxR family maltose regulon positive regulatory protein
MDGRAASSTKTFAVRAGLELARSTGVHVFDYLLLLHGLYGSLSSCNLTVASELLPELGRKYADWSQYYYIASWYAFVCNDLALALAHGEAALQASEKEGRPFFDALCHGGLARVLRRLGNRDRARHHNKKYLTIGRSVGSTFVLFAGHLSAAELALDDGDHSQAVEQLRAGFTLGREHGFTDFLWWLPDVMARLCAEALKAGIEVEYVRGLIKLRGLQAPALDIENWPWPLKLFTLGGFAVLKDGQPITFSRKAPKKVIALLKAIIAFGGRDVSERKLTDALWPDEEGDAAHDAFAVNLHRLRKLIDEDVVTLQEGGLTLDLRRCWIDALAFERLLDQAESLTMSERVALTEKRWRCTAALSSWAIRKSRGRYRRENGCARNLFVTRRSLAGI